MASQDGAEAPPTSSGNEQDTINTAQASQAVPDESTKKNDLETSLVDQLDKKLVSSWALANTSDVFCAIIMISALLGLPDDLNLKGWQFNMLFAMFHIGGMVSPVRFTQVSVKLCQSRASLPGWAALSGLLLMGVAVSRNFTQALWLCFSVGVVDTAIDMSVSELHRSWFVPGEVRLPSAGIASANVWASYLSFIGAIMLRKDQSLPTSWRRTCAAMGLVHALYFAVLAYWKHPGFPETAAWPTQAERALIGERSAKRASATSEPKRLTFTFLRNIKVWKLAMLQIPVHVANSYATFWPIIFARTMKIDKMTPAWLLVVGLPWVIPALMMGNTKLYNNHRKQGPTFFPSQFSLQQASSMLAFLGFGIACFTTHKMLLVPALFLMPLLDIGRLASLFAFVWGPKAFVAEPVEVKSARTFINMFGLASNVLGSFLWPLEYNEDLYKRLFAIQGLAILLTVYAVRFCLQEIAAGKNATQKNGEGVDVVKSEEVDPFDRKEMSNDVDEKV